MNNSNFYTNPAFQGLSPNGSAITASGNIATTPSYAVNSQNQMLDIEQSYIENILRLNRGKLATFYFSFPDSVEWRDKTFTGIIEAAGRDHIIISDPNTGRWYLLLMIYLNYVDFDEKINYSKEFYLPNQ